ncbi:MAG: dephospho-CoA kinase [Tatlockia sp.]|nr:dephospho-CoA kinase [Tatlockia sp.]
MFCVGLTGNIASGKSTVSQLFKKMGVTIISADEASRELTKVNQPALKAIEKHFGKVFIKPSGELDRFALRQTIFNDPKQRLWLEQLLHPLIRQFMENKLDESTGPYAIVEIPLLKNRNDYPYLNRVLLILAPKEKVIQRILERDHCDKEQAEAILSVQGIDDLVKRNLADDIINNEGTVDDLVKKVDNLHHQYLQFASQKP